MWQLYTANRFDSQAEPLLLLRTDGQVVKDAHRIPEYLLQGRNSSPGHPEASGHSPLFSENLNPVLASLAVAYYER